MATKLEAIGELLTGAGLQIHVDEAKARIETGYRMTDYLDPEGQPLLGILIGVAEGGEFIRIVAPFCYLCRKSDHFPAVLEACNHATRMFKRIRFELDTDDGEVRAEVNLPLEDAALTQRQLVRILTVFPEALNSFDAKFRDAIENGKFIPWEDPVELHRAFLEFMRQRRQAKQRQR